MPARAVGLSWCLLGLIGVASLAAAEPLKLHQRKRVETAEGSGRFHAVTEEVAWDPTKTAIAICDMWDEHWCPDATQRVGQMAPRMNEVIKAARARGVLIIHCPSNTLKFYEGTPQLKLANDAPKVETKIPLERWCYLNKDREIALPIDDSDGGCDTLPSPATRQAWSRQIATIEIAEGDAISDSPSAFYLMKQRGIENLIVMGVHTNMCVLGRPFSIRQMVYQGLNVVLMRDMTDTMYNPAKAPFVSHFTGTDLVVEHIERHWCPTILSGDFLDGHEFRFPGDKRPTVAILMAEDEYKTEQSLTKFAAEHLGKQFRTRLIYGSDTERNHIPGLAELDDADALLVSVRRRTLPKGELDLIRKYVASGRPVVGIRTASHAFAARAGQAAPEGADVWNDFDPTILGGHYTGHHENGPKTALAVAPQAGEHPILKNVDVAKFEGIGSLYLVSPLAEKAQPLLIGTVKGHAPEPVAWTHVTPAGGKVFYTSLGHIDDFKQEAFQKLLVNALVWATTKAD